MITVAIISDTHGLLRKQVLAQLSDVDYIIHAGDVGSKAILDRLARIAPLTAVQGNTDFSFLGLARSELIEIGNYHFFVQHIAEDIEIDPQAAGVDVVITGHTHRYDVQRKKGVLYLNPGSVSYPRDGSIPSMIRLSISEQGELATQKVQLK